MCSASNSKRWTQGKPIAGKPCVCRNTIAAAAPGSFVTCAVTGQRIPLADLKYWSVDRQEAYATPDAATQAFSKADYSEG